MLSNIDIITIHLDWISRGYNFNDILSVYEELTPHPFNNIGLLDIQRHIGGPVYPYLSDQSEILALYKKVITESDYEKITFIFYNEHGFDGNLDFLERCINIEYIKVGCSCLGKIENLEPLKNLTKLKYIDFHRHNISDLSPLASLENLEDLMLWDNPIKTIRPIVHLKNIKKASFSVVEDDEVLELLKNSVNADVSYSSALDPDPHTNDNKMDAEITAQKPAPFGKNK